MDKVQILDNIKKYGTIDAFCTVFFVVLTTYIDNIYLDIASTASMIFWVLFIKNVAIFYNYKGLDTLNIIATVGLAISMTSIGIIIRQIPQVSEDIFYEPSNVEIFLSFLVLGLSIVLIVSIVMFMIIMYKLAKTTQSKIFFYCFWIFIFYVLSLILFAVFGYGEIFEHETVVMFLTIAISGLFFYGVIKFYNEKKISISD